ncbi:MAG TPA: hypothetical protein VHN14_12635 [Kofleriaceae bacterium]|jgi:hypothetical protein|nr:hypothetical protein [Kofleriaceae bacterium]
MSSALATVRRKWAEVRADSIALLAYQPRYAELGAILLPVLILGGERSAPYFRGTLAAALPNGMIVFSSFASIWAAAGR